jgi:hypothetical protein
LFLLMPESNSQKKSLKSKSSQLCTPTAFKMQERFHVGPARTMELLDQTLL